MMDAPWDEFKSANPMSSFTSAQLIGGPLDGRLVEFCGVHFTLVHLIEVRGQEKVIEHTYALAFQPTPEGGKSVGEYSGARELKGKDAAEIAAFIREQSKMKDL